MTADEVVTAYWEAADARDWAAFARLLAEDVVYELPQTRERVRGRQAYLAFNVEGFPGPWRVRVLRVVGEGRHAASWVELTEGDGSRLTALSFFELDDVGAIAAVTDFWPEPYEPPPGRAHLTERS